MNTCKLSKVVPSLWDKREASRDNVPSKTAKEALELPQSKNANPLVVVVSRQAEIIEELSTTCLLRAIDWTGS